MQKEVTDIVNICNTIISKTQSVNEIAEALKELAKDIQENTGQADIPLKSLSMRKPLAALFIMNSNFDDLIKNFEKIYDDLKKI